MPRFFQWCQSWTTHQLNTEHSHCGRYATLLFTTVGFTTLSSNRSTCQYHFLFYASCGTWSALVPLLLCWRHYLLSVLFSLEASCLCVQQCLLSFQAFWRFNKTDIPWMEMFYLCHLPRCYHQQARERRTIVCQKGTVAFLRANRKRNHPKNCGM